MRQQTIEFKKGTVIEVSFATVKKGKDGQLFGEYFPKVIPIIEDIGGQPLGSFTILEALTTLDNPKICALFQWPNLEGFKKLHSDPRFLAIKNIRDDSLSFFLNGLFFTVEEDTEVQFNENESYLLSAVQKNVNLLNDTPLVNLNTTIVASENCYQPNSIQIEQWSEQIQQRFDSSVKGIDLYTLAMNFPK